MADKRVKNIINNSDMEMEISYGDSEKESCLNGSLEQGDDVRDDLDDDDEGYFKQGEGLEDEEDDESGDKVNLDLLRLKCGVIYLSHIPELMSVKKVRQIFSEYGEVDRIFLQPDGL